MRGPRGVGIGLRPQLATTLHRAPGSVDFVEVVAETCGDPRARREAIAVAEVWPVVPHGVKLSLGSADGIDEERARAFGCLARELRAPLVSEHVSFTHAGGREIGHLTELPMTREAVGVVARNVATLRRHLPDVPLILENVARAFVWDAAAHEMSEGAFHHEIVAATGCELLLDAGNLFANASNACLDPFELLATYPLEHVRMIHVAGGVIEHGFYFDTHAHPVPERVFELVERVLAIRPDAAVMLERDASFDAPELILAELDRLRRLERGPVRQRAAMVRSAATNVSAKATADLATAQAALAETLTLTDVAGGASDASSLPLAIVRARGVLARKRAEEALRLLPRLAGHLSVEGALALGRIAETPRARTMAAVADALRVAEAALSDPTLSELAARDGICLRGRFAEEHGQPHKRLLPWVGRELLEDGRALWAWKGFGRSSTVHLRARRADRSLE